MGIQAWFRRLSGGCCNNRLDAQAQCWLLRQSEPRQDQDRRGFEAWVVCEAKLLYWLLCAVVGG